MGKPSRLAKPSMEATGGRDLQEVVERQRKRIEELEAVRADLEQFASVLCHDLQAPITVQQLKAGVVRRLLERGDTEGAYAATQQLDDVNRKMSSMIQAMLGFSRAGNAAITKKRCALGDIVGNAVAMHEMDLRSSGAVIDVADLPAIDGDEALLTLLFQNLVGNAIKYRMPDRTPRIDVTAPRDAPPGFVAVEVRDNGRGFQPEEAEKMMEPFERLADDVPGHGIGLATCQRIVERHGGRIEARGKAGQGATFRVEMPGIGR